MNKKIIVVTPSRVEDYGRSNIENQLWFAIKAANRHLELSSKGFKDEKQMWLYAHLLIAGTVSKWYPAAAGQAFAPFPAARIGPLILTHPFKYLVKIMGISYARH